MGHKNREIEKKFVIEGKAMKKVSTIIHDALRRDFQTVLKDESRDYYWSPQKGMKADFIRLRLMPDGTGQLTVKWSDRGSTTNRVEIDVTVPDPEQCRKYLTQVHGKPTGSIYKEYHVYFMDKFDTNVSVYQVKGDSRVFVEVEAHTLARVNGLVKKVGTALEMAPETRSLYQIFIEGK